MKKVFYSLFVLFVFIACLLSFLYSLETRKEFRRISAETEQAIKESLKLDLEAKEVLKKSKEVISRAKEITLDGVKGQRRVLEFLRSHNHMDEETYLSEMKKLEEFERRIQEE